MSARSIAALVLACAAPAALGCRAPCNLDIDQPLCIDRFNAVDLWVHRLDPEDGPSRSTSRVIASARGDVLLGADWAMAQSGTDLLLGFPDAASAGVLPPFTAEGACSVGTRRQLTLIPDITVQRQPRLQLAIGTCATRSQVLFTGPADFGRAVLAWPHADGRPDDLWFAAPSEGLYRGALYGFFGGASRGPALRNHEVADVILEGEFPGDRLGTVLLRCADPTGQQPPLLVVGLPGWGGTLDDDPAPHKGAVALFDPTTIERRRWRLDDAVAVIEGAEQGDRLGQAIACNADVDGDGRNDLALGAPGAQGRRGAVYVLSASVRGTSRAEESATLAWVGRDDDEELGRAVALADLDGDGLADLIAGTPGLGPAGAGGVRVLTAADLLAGEPRVTTLQGRPSEDRATSPRLGTTVVAADLSGDGRPDLAAGAWRQPQRGRFHAGEIQVWSLDADQLGSELTADQATTLPGETSHQQLGRRMATADATADGSIELLTVGRRRAR